METRRLNILFLTDNFPPERNVPAMRTWEHVSRWVKDGHQVTVITTAPNFPQGKPLAGFARQALHAWQLQLIHPATQQSQVFVAPIPPDLLTLAAELQIALPAQPPAASSEGA